MYEVFLNDYRIILADEGEPIPSGSHFKIHNTQEEFVFRDVVDNFLSGEENFLIYGNAERHWHEFRQLFSMIPAAGGIVRSPFGVLFIYRRGKWDLPKGKIDSGEKSADSALREVREETGLQYLKIIGRLPSTWHIYLYENEKKKKVWILKETQWFMMESPGDEPLIPQTIEDIEEVKWVPENHFGDILTNTYASLKQLIMNLRL